MYILAAVFIGMATSFTVLANGRLSDALNPYRASVIIHLVGLLVQSAAMVARKADMRLRRGLPLPYYLGGALGVVTVTFSMYAFSHLGVAAVVALNLLGMTVSSVLVDQFGWFGMPRHPLSVFKLISLLVITAGVLVLLLPLDLTAVTAILLALLTGITVVVSRTLNARMLHFHTLHISTLFNYITGLITSFILLVILTPEAVLAPFALQSDWMMYTGGAVGVVMVSLTTIVVVRMPAYDVTVLMFLGQYFFGMVLDALSGRKPTLQAVLGGAIVLGGLLINYIDKRKRIGSVT